MMEVGGSRLHPRPGPFPTERGLLPSCQCVPAPSPAVSIYKWGALILQTVKCHVHTASDGHRVLIFSVYVLKSTVQKRKVGTVLVVQGLRIRLPS